LQRIDDAVGKINKIDTEKEITLDLNSKDFMKDWNDIMKQVGNPTITFNIKLNDEGKQFLKLFGESPTAEIKATGIETTSKELVNNISEGVSKGIGNQTISVETGAVPTPIPVATKPVETTQVQKHQIDINLKFEGQPPSGVNQNDIKEIVRKEIGKAIRSVY